jgi:hypothetical protein
LMGEAIGNSVRRNAKQSTGEILGLSRINTLADRAVRLSNLSNGQHNKWLCSDKCRRAANAKSVREFYKRRPLMEAIYRQRIIEKRLSDSNNIRFYKTNPTAPRACESCGEGRVTEIAHKPGYERLRQGRRTTNTKWPDQVWVLCPTCHRVLDRMHYAPSDLGLTWP